MGFRKATCPRCGRQNEPVCPNCGGTRFFGNPADFNLSCTRCALTYSDFQCQAPGCDCLIGAALFNPLVPSGGCFIATELYGGDSAEVACLRSFRNRVLLTNRIGAEMVRAYYRTAPSLIPLMRRWRPVRAALQSVVALSVVLVRVVRRRGRL
jgi:hypothetical protein